MNAVSPEIAQRRAEINRLFDLVNVKVGMKEAEVFRRCYANAPDEERAAALHAFLLEVSSCPDEVIFFCQTLIAPKQQAA